MPPDWDDDSPELRATLTRLLESVEEDARRRVKPTVEAARRWQSDMMRGLAVEPKYVGAFRGEPGLEWVQVRVGDIYGVASDDVSSALHDFERRLQSAVALFDDVIAPGAEPNDDQVGAIIELCAWAHAEWVRIHPFANGNGRTARLWANSLAMRYGLPPFVRLRPRPDGSYGIVSRKAMLGDWQPTVALFGELLADVLEESDPDV
ncbi:MAG: Fic family protein [Alphaproteobacteria bacterium]|nr:Fic family protein [Alphaproteobacteria bacterium]MCW5744036.1 Fic family protein [Alphaproteobacteria bacterium]